MAYLKGDLKTMWHEPFASTENDPNTKSTTTTTTTTTTNSSTTPLTKYQEIII